MATAITEESDIAVAFLNAMIICKKVLWRDVELL